MSCLPESPLACCIPSSTKDTKSSHPPVGVGPGLKETPAGAELAGPALAPHSPAARVEWPDSAAFWPSQWVDYLFGSLASWQEPQLLLGFLIYQGWAEQQEAEVSCQGFCSLCAQQGLKVEILAVKLLSGHQVSSTKLLFKMYEKLYE